MNFRHKPPLAVLSLPFVLTGPAFSQTSAPGQSRRYFLRGGFENPPESARGLPWQSEADRKSTPGRRKGAAVDTGFSAACRGWVLPPNHGCHSVARRS